MGSGSVWTACELWAVTVEKDVLGPAPEPGATMLVIPPGLSEEEEALQKKFNNKELIKPSLEFTAT